jgi:hypothetical protein
MNMTSDRMEPGAAMLGVQNELLATYEQATRAWLARMKSEVDLWSELSSGLAATRTLPEAMQACQESMSKRMQMAAEDARGLTEECGKITQKMSGSLGKAG